MQSVSKYKKIETNIYKVKQKYLQGSLQNDA